MNNFATKLWLLIVILLALGAAASAQTSGKRTVIHAGKLLDVKSGKTETNQAIVIQGDKIVSVGPASGAQSSAGDQVIELPNATVLPGLIDAHVHTLLQGDITAEDYDTQLFKESMAYRALRASKAVKIALGHGFTTVRDLETEGAMYTDVDVKRAINNGIIDGPRMVVSTRALSVTGGYGPSGYAPDVTYPMGVQIVDELLHGAHRRRNRFLGQLHRPIGEE